MSQPASIFLKMRRPTAMAANPAAIIGLAIFQSPWRSPKGIIWTWVITPALSANRTAW